MAISRTKTWIAGEVLTAADLNAEFSNIINNGEDVGWPATKAKDFDGQRLILDADADTSFTSDTDDQIDIEIAGADDFRFTANKFEALSGSSIDMNGGELVFDDDADSSLTADTDDRLDIKLQGQDLFRFDGTVASAVNGLDFVGVATGSDVRIEAEGSDTNIGIDIRGKGTGVITLTDAGGLELLKTARVASAVNEVTVLNAATGNAPEVQATGDDTNIDLDLKPKGTGLVLFGGTAPLNGVSQVQVVRKASDETVNNSTTLQDDDDLTVSVAANEIIHVWMHVFYEASTAADFKLTIAGPTGVAGEWSVGNVRTDPSVGVTLSGSKEFGVIHSLQGAGVGTPLSVFVAGTVRNGANAGNVRLQWAQNTADMSDTKVLLDSDMIVWRE